jgi:hypothetical protein
MLVYYDNSAFASRMQKVSFFLDTTWIEMPMPPARKRERYSQQPSVRPGWLDYCVIIDIFEVCKQQAAYPPA